MFLIIAFFVSVHQGHTLSFVEGSAHSAFFSMGVHGSRGLDTKLAGINVKTGLCTLRSDEVKRLSAYSICFLLKESLTVDRKDYVCSCFSSAWKLLIGTYFIKYIWR